MSILSQLKNKIFRSLGGRRWTKYFIARIITSFIPLNHDKYFCISMAGNNYGCNVLALSEYIKKHNKKAKITWAFSPTLFQKHSGGGVVTCGFRYYYHLLSSKYVISNQRLSESLYPFKPKNQVYIQTWHGTALKKIEADAVISESYTKLAQADSRKIDIFISNCRFMTEIFKKSFWYEGEVFETGTPRNDIFFNNYPYITKKVYDSLGIEQSKKIIFYAPTFRKDYGLNYYNINYKRFVKAVKEKFSGDWVFVIRLHPNLLSENTIKIIEKMFPDCVDASLYPDVQELLYTSDILLTDYSSVMFDFMYSQKPCFLYTPDRKEYDRGYSWDIDELPFPAFCDNADINSTVINFSDDIYQEKLNRFLCSIGSKEYGDACRKVYQLLQTYKVQNCIG